MAAGDRCSFGPLRLLACGWRGGSTLTIMPAQRNKIQSPSLLGMKRTSGYFDGNDLSIRANYFAFYYQHEFGLAVQKNRPANVQVY